MRLENLHAEVTVYGDDSKGSEWLRINEIASNGKVYEAVVVLTQSGFARVFSFFTVEESHINHVRISRSRLSYSARFFSNREPGLVWVMPDEAKNEA
ncbi:uncharacterized protein RSE6_13353 [Rhynchosporium secalis]|uniref:Uncharacterized protein n=1 Tax=Rhynchosporium secalis TaxID=38038 RepID=A0A1E1MSN6_RHYSE|nr:uncharacterized protein RSE6_13353 [Rhynchosporium secalis]